MAIIQVVSLVLPMIGMSAARGMYVGFAYMRHAGALAGRAEEAVGPSDTS